MSPADRRSRPVECFERYSELASRALYAFGVYAALPALLALVSLDVALRYFFNAPLQWGRDANGLLLLMTLFSALPRAWDSGYHIRMEIIYTRLSRRARAAADVLSASAGFALFALITVQALHFLLYMNATGETGEDLPLPLWPFMGFIAAASLVFTARIIANPFGAPEQDNESRTQWL